MIKDFFLQHKKELEEFYPGISCQRLEREFEECTCSLESFLDSLKKGIPLSYISGKAAFWSLELQVDQRVLIPRPETEMLVELALKFLKPHQTFVDVGTGSGAIALALLYESKKNLTALLTDLSEDALSLAKENAHQYKKNFHKDSSLKFFQGDRLLPLDNSFEKGIDLIISNPPYIKAKKDLNFVHSSVLKFEPHMALFLKDEEYQTWFEDFFNQSKKYLKKDGLFLMEGHEDHLDELALLAQNLKFDSVEIIKDLSGKKRFLKMTLRE